MPRMCIYLSVSDFVLALYQCLIAYIMYLSLRSFTVSAHYKLSIVFIELKHLFVNVSVLRARNLIPKGKGGKFNSLQFHCVMYVQEFNLTELSA